MKTLIKNLDLVVIISAILLFVVCLVLVIANINVINLI